MNNIVTLNDLANLLASKAEMDHATALNLIGDVLDSLQESILNEQASFEIPKLGIFKLEGNQLTFVPNKNLATSVNEPFNVFEPVKYDTSLESPEAFQEDSLIQNAIVENSVPVVNDTITQTMQSEVQHENDSQLDNVTEENTNEIPENIDTSSDQKTTVSHNECPEELVSEVDESNDIEEKHYYKHNPLLAFIFGLLTGMILVCIAVYFLYPPLYSDDYDLYDASDTDEYQSLSAVPDSSYDVLASDSTNILIPDLSTESEQISKDNINDIITDTVTSKYFLASMARKYFGRMEFWIYIYLENKDVLTDPDHIAPGTVVVIPPKAKYGIDADDQQSVARAQQAINEVYNP